MYCNQEVYVGFFFFHIRKLNNRVKKIELNNKKIHIISKSLKLFLVVPMEKSFLPHTADFCSHFSHSFINISLSNRILLLSNHPIIHT